MIPYPNDHKGSDKPSNRATSYNRITEFPNRDEKRMGISGTGTETNEHMETCSGTTEKRQEQSNRDPIPILQKAKPFLSIFEFPNYRFYLLFFCQTFFFIFLPFPILPFSQLFPSRLYYFRKNPL
jgi:hypothetical protein